MSIDFRPSAGLPAGFACWRSGRWSTATALLVAVTICAGCDSFRAGACVHTYRDPLIAIQSVTDSVSGSSIPQVHLHSVSVNGIARTARDLADAPPHSRVTAIGDTLICSVACGFGTFEGTWRFTATAAGYAPTTIQAVGKYARFDGGCPSSNSGSVALRIKLPRA